MYSVGQSYNSRLYCYKRKIYVNLGIDIKDNLKQGWIQLKIWPWLPFTSTKTKGWPGVCPSVKCLKTNAWKSHFQHFDIIQLFCQSSIFYFLFLLKYIVTKNNLSNILIKLIQNFSKWEKSDHYSSHVCHRLELPLYEVNYSSPFQFFCPKLSITIQGKYLGCLSLKSPIFPSPNPTYEIPAGLPQARCFTKGLSLSRLTDCEDNFAWPLSAFHFFYKSVLFLL